jgi:flagellar biosynthesis protein FlhG
VQRHEPEDQAAGLRRLLGERNTLRALGVFGPDAELNAVATANLAFALRQRGDKICLIDEAHAPRNAASLFGLSPMHGLGEVAHGGVCLNDALASPYDGLHLLAADRGFDHAAEADDRVWNRIGEDFARHEWEWLLLAAPSDERLPSLALAAPQRLLVLPAAKSRLTEAYAVLKTSSRKQPDTRWLVLFMNAGGDDKVSQLMTALNETARQFLDIGLEAVGAVPKDPQLDNAARTLYPVLERSPTSPASQAFRQLAERLDDDPAAENGLGAKLIWQRMGLFSRMNQQPRHSKRHVQHGRAYG